MHIIETLSEYLFLWFVLAVAVGLAFGQCVHFTDKCEPSYSDEALTETDK